MLHRQPEWYWNAGKLNLLLWNLLCWFCVWIFVIYCPASVCSVIVLGKFWRGANNTIVVSILFILTYHSFLFLLIILLYLFILTYHSSLSSLLCRAKMSNVNSNTGYSYSVRIYILGWVVSKPRNRIYILGWVVLKPRNFSLFAHS